jgi:hypothetical protein
MIQYRSAAASYNSFRTQVGFCKMQGFDTVSRSTSGGIPTFLDGTIHIGAGLSNVQFNNSVTNCGRCIRVHQVDGFALFNRELTAWTGGSSFPFLVSVFDQCTDAVCTSGFLDFDIYSMTQPVSGGNPRNLLWDFIPCPVRGPTELLFCLSDACSVDKQEGRSTAEVLAASSPSYFSVFVRNRRVPPTTVAVNGTPLRDQQGWVWDHGVFDFTASFTVQIMDEERYTVRLLDHAPTTGYRGGILIAMY